jgi:hypothetical protein
MSGDLNKSSVRLKSTSPEMIAERGSPAVAPVVRDPVVPEEVRALLGPSWLIEGEDPKLYEELLAKVGAAVQPMDIIDWLLVKDVVALTWDIHRSRRHRESLMRTTRRNAMERILDLSLSRDLALREVGQESKAGKIARGWFNGDEEATKHAEELVAACGLSMADVTAQSLSIKAPEFDRLDQQNQRHEDRRDKILQQIERRRTGWAKQVRRATDDAIDAEFRETIPGSSGALPNGEISKSA